MDHPGSWTSSANRDAFARIQRIKRRSNVVGNGWSSLRHFRRFPEDTRPPCSAGWVQATMDPPKASSFPAPSSTGATDPTASHGSGRRRHSPICPERAVANAGARAWSREIMPGGCASITHAPTVRTRAAPIRGCCVSLEGLDLAAPPSAARARNEPRTHFLAGLAPLWTVLGTGDRHPAMQS